MSHYQWDLWLAYKYVLCIIYCVSISWTVGKGALWVAEHLLLSSNSTYCWVTEGTVKVVVY